MCIAVQCSAMVVVVVVVVQYNSVREGCSQSACAEAPFSCVGVSERLWGTTLAEVLVPVVVMLIMVGIRGAISIDDKGIGTCHKPLQRTSDVQCGVH